MKIRSDLVGVVWVEVDGERTALKAGDDIPAGIELGEHLTRAPKKPVENEGATQEDSTGGTGNTGRRRSASRSSSDG